MKTELLTFQTTVRVTYDPARPKARLTAIGVARELTGKRAISVAQWGDYGQVTAKVKRSVYRPKVPPSTPYTRMAGVDR